MQINPRWPQLLNQSLRPINLIEVDALLNHSLTPINAASTSKVHKYWACDRGEKGPKNPQFSERHISEWSLVGCREWEVADVHPGVNGGAVVEVEGEAAGGAAQEGHGDGVRRQPVGVL